MSDNNQVQDIRQAASARGRKLGEPKPIEAPSQLDQMTDDEIKRHLQARGLELRKARRTKGVMAQPDNVTGKTRLTIHMPTQLVKDVKAAALETNKNESTIVSEACPMWKSANNLGNE